MNNTELIIAELFDNNFQLTS